MTMTPDEMLAEAAGLRAGAEYLETQAEAERNSAQLIYSMGDCIRAHARADEWDKEAKRDRRKAEELELRATLAR